ncbi:MAG: class I SAM-dependent methyltransferase [Candidatus Thorarchaeota archaeon]
MAKKKTYWLQAYKEVVECRKQGPDFKLIEYLDIIPKGPVLDLGMGRGRHALFFAKLGRAVEGVDTSKFSKGLPEIIEAEGLEFVYHKMNLRDFEFPTRKYALIVAAKILQLFQKPDIEMIADRMQAALKPKGVIYVYTYSVEDLQYIQNRDKIEEVEKNTFYHANYNLHFHFFSKEEILGLFQKLKLHHYTEGLVFDRSPRRSRLNGVIQYIGQRMR